MPGSLVRPTNPDLLSRLQSRWVELPSIMFLCDVRKNPEDYARYFWERMLLGEVLFGEPTDAVSIGFVFEHLLVWKSPHFLPQLEEACGVVHRYLDGGEVPLIGPHTGVEVLGSTAQPG